MVTRLSSLLLALALLVGANEPRADERSILLASTTSTENSGFFAHLLPQFTAATGIEVRVVAVGTGIAGLFSLFGCRTLQRHLTKVAINDHEICNVAFRTRVLGWAELERFKLRYYGTKRQEKGSEGFMQLTLKGGGQSLTYDSGIEGFAFITWRATKAARENGVSFDPVSAGNLLAIGLDADRETPPPPA